MALRLSFAASALVALNLSLAPAPAAGAVAFAPQTSERSESEAAFDQLVGRAKSSMMGDPGEALESARNAEAVARSLVDIDGQETAIATSLWLQAEALIRLNRSSEARPFIDQALEIIATESETKLSGDLLLSRGRVARLGGDIEAALRSFHDAHDIFAWLSELRSQAIALQNIGSIYNDARSFDRVLEYYERASLIYQNDAALDMSSYNNRANALRELGEYDQALDLFERALEVSDQFNSPLLQARILTNIASTHVKRADLDAAEASADRGLALLSDTDATGWGRFLWGLKAEIAFERGDLLAARDNISRTFAGMEMKGRHGGEARTAPFREFHEIAYKIWNASGDYEAALRHHEAFKELDDYGREASSSANMALLGAEFDFTTQALEIEQLKTEQLQRDIELSETRARQRVMIFAGLFVLTLAVAGSIGVAYASVHQSRNEVHDANEKLQGANAKLKETNEALERANQAKTDFLATTSHEIRTPLNAIIGMTDVMLRQGQVESGEQDRLETIRAAGDTLLAVVNDVLDIAKIESGRLEIVKSNVDLHVLADDLEKLWGETAKEKGLEFVVERRDCPKFVLTDETRLRQILFNLVSNAIKFTPSGRITLALSAKQNGGDEELHVEVSDSGIGIPETELENIFKTFQQVDSGASRKFGGTGLGLAICRKVARAMGGDVAVRSTLGAGSTFTLATPLERGAERPASRNEGSLQPVPRDISALNVLVAEDNPMNQTVIKALLSGSVKKVDVVDDGVAAIEALRHMRYDVIMMDKQMPNMDGVTATKTIRAMSDDVRDIYIVAVTADAFDGAREQMIQNGMDDYIAKPVTQDILVAALWKAIERNLSHSGGAGDRDPAAAAS